MMAYKVLRTRVLHRMRTNKWRTLLVSSSGTNEGKSLTASNLAISISADVNQSVFLVDLDLQHFSIAKYIGIEVFKGVADYLMGDAEIADIIHTPSGMARLAVIPNRAPVENSSDLLASPRMKELIAWLRSQSEKSIVIFDMPPVLAGDDVLAFLPNVDAALLVVSQGETNRSALKKMMELLADCNVLGIVLNKSIEHNGGEAYSYY